MTKLTGWGRNHWSTCEVQQPERAEAVRAALTPTTIARGLGRSYGDPATNDGHRVVDLTRLDRFLAFDPASGELTCEAGVSLEAIIRAFAPRGFFPAITPGTKFVTVGGCIANDVHGKAHHSQGSFNTSVKSMKVLLASGEVVTLSRDQRPDLFWATFGGMGLLGVVLEATLTLRRVETTYFKQRAVVCDDLEALLDAIDESDRAATYSVATIDPQATGRHLGRGVLTLGDHASRDELPPALRDEPLKVAPPSALVVPFQLPGIALNPLTAGVVNRVIGQVLRRAPTYSHAEGFFYPLDAIGEWNRGYGPRGFTQYQFCVPLRDGRAQMRTLLEAIVGSGLMPFLNVLKRMGKDTPSQLAFPFEGYTLAIDFPIRDGTQQLAQRLDAMVIAAGGRVYLGKDSFLTPASLRAMYPRVEEWLALKHQVDPAGVFSSDLGRRVGLSR